MATPRNGPEPTSPQLGHTQPAVDLPKSVGTIPESSVTINRNTQTRRRVVGWRLSRNMQTGIALDAQEQALFCKPARTGSACSSFRSRVPVPGELAGGTCAVGRQQIFMMGACVVDYARTSGRRQTDCADRHPPLYGHTLETSSGAPAPRPHSGTCHGARHGARYFGGQS